jgi:hypothetical protein
MPQISKEDLIKNAVNRFLGWKLPADFAPDAGISFKPYANHQMSAEYQYKHEPIGTNLFTADQARAMFEHVLEALYTHPAPFTPITADDVTDEMMANFIRGHTDNMTYAKTFMVAVNAYMKGK